MEIIGAFMASKPSKFQELMHKTLKMQNYMPLTPKIHKNFKFFEYFPSTRKYEVRGHIEGYHSIIGGIPSTPKSPQS